MNHNDMNEEEYLEKVTKNNITLISVVFGVLVLFALPMMYILWR
ncbi:hypothetical protein SDC9_57903 [bioreactor metagenome]|uniref:Uncharacterized protein n=1 Tax=bioreactor metagenome TaxID=1076179 RepID=A0A644X6J0_9ZZZZ